MYCKLRGVLATCRKHAIMKLKSVCPASLVVFVILFPVPDAQAKEKKLTSPVSRNFISLNADALYHPDQGEYQDEDDNDTANRGRQSRSSRRRQRTRFSQAGEDSLLHRRISKAMKTYLRKKRISLSDLRRLYASPVRRKRKKKKSSSKIKEVAAGGAAVPQDKTYEGKENGANRLPYSQLLAERTMAYEGQNVVDKTSMNEADVHNQPDLADDITFSERLQSRTHPFQMHKVLHAMEAPSIDEEVGSEFSERVQQAALDIRLPDRPAGAQQDRKLLSDPANTTETLLDHYGSQAAQPEDILTQVLQDNKQAEMMLKNPHSQRLQVSLGASSKLLKDQQDQQHKKEEGVRGNEASSKDSEQHQYSPSHLSDTDTARIAGHFRPVVDPYLVHRVADLSHSGSESSRQAATVYKPVNRNAALTELSSWGTRGDLQHLVHTNGETIPSLKSHPQGTSSLADDNDNIHQGVRLTDDKDDDDESDPKADKQTSGNVKNSAPFFGRYMALHTKDSSLALQARPVQHKAHSAAADDRDFSNDMPEQLMGRRRQHLHVFHHPSKENILQDPSKENILQDPSKENILSDPSKENILSDPSLTMTDMGTIKDTSGWKSDLPTGVQKTPYLTEDSKHYFQTADKQKGNDVQDAPSPEQDSEAITPGESGMFQAVRIGNVQNIPKSSSSTLLDLKTMAELDDTSQNNLFLQKSLTSVKDAQAKANVLKEQTSLSALTPANISSVVKKLLIALKKTKPGPTENLPDGYLSLARNLARNFSINQYGDIQREDLSRKTKITLENANLSLIGPYESRYNSSIYSPNQQRKTPPDPGKIYPLGKGEELFRYGVGEATTNLPDVARRRIISLFLSHPVKPVLPWSLPDDTNSSTILWSVRSRTSPRNQDSIEENGANNSTSTHALAFLGDFDFLSRKYFLAPVIGGGTLLLLFSLFLCACGLARWHRLRRYRKAFNKLEANFSRLDTDRPLYLRLSQLRRCQAGTQYVVTIVDDSKFSVVDHDLESEDEIFDVTDIKTADKKGPLSRLHWTTSKLPY